MKGGRVITFFLFALVAKYCLSDHITVMLNDRIILPFSGSCHGGVMEWRHCQGAAGSFCNKTVATFDGNNLIPGEGYENRVQLQNGNLSLTISSAEYNDMGWYECVCNNKVLQDVELEVLVPTEISFFVGDNVTLPFHGFTGKWTKDSEIYIQCFKDGHIVFTISGGYITYGSGYQDRVSVSMDGYRKGDISFILTNLRRSDQGTYWCFFGPDYQRGYPGAVTLTVTPKEKHCDDTGRPTMVVVVVVVVLVIILAAVVFYFLGGRLKETMPAWFKGNCLRSQFSPCPEGEQGGEHLSVTISESESETEEDRTGTRTCCVPFAPACIIRALSEPPFTTGLVTNGTNGPPSTPGLVTKATDGPPSTPSLVTKATDGPPSTPGLDTNA
ncbi:uncharacterized protein [Salmo salar]|uniref:Immunoglobulin domain-containing protein n=1 Tax=Salmo salar TaxID=8030 RepID=A0ABM3DFD9_SALSA|nr:uncharacterized protein LOC123728759 [Salmo salar]